MSKEIWVALLTAVGVVGAAWVTARHNLKKAREDRAAAQNDKA